MRVKFKFRVLSKDEQSRESSAFSIRLPTGIDPTTLQSRIESSKRVEIEFIGSADAEAYRQAFLIRRQLRFRGDLRAIGEITPDQLMQLERAGFTSAVLNDDVDIPTVVMRMRQFSSSLADDAKAERVSW
jgi:uncharacterized protein (DUF934 family)